VVEILYQGAMLPRCPAFLRRGRVTGNRAKLRSIFSGRSRPLLAGPAAQRESPRTLSACVYV